jgi:hypothetical protein
MDRLDNRPFSEQFHYRQNVLAKYKNPLAKGDEVGVAVFRLVPGQLGDLSNMEMRLATADGGGLIHQFAKSRKWKRANPKLFVSLEVRLWQTRQPSSIRCPSALQLVAFLLRHFSQLPMFVRRLLLARLPMYCKSIEHLSPVVLSQPLGYC